MAVWEAVRDALQKPDVLVEEFRRRLAEAGATSDWAFERKKVKLALRRAEGKIDKLTDAYLNDALELADYKSKMEEPRAQRVALQVAAKDLDRGSDRRIAVAAPWTTFSDSAARLPRGWLQ